MIEEVFQKSLHSGGVHFKALMAAENSAESHVEAFKIFFTVLPRKIPISLGICFGVP